MNPRPFGIEPESTALDHSATSTFLQIKYLLLSSFNSMSYSHTYQYIIQYYKIKYWHSSYRNNRTLIIEKSIKIIIKVLYKYHNLYLIVFLSLSSLINISLINNLSTDALISRTPGVKTLIIFPTSSIIFSNLNTFLTFINLTTLASTA